MTSVAMNLYRCFVCSCLLSHSEMWNEMTVKAMMGFRNETIGANLAHNTTDSLCLFLLPNRQTTSLLELSPSNQLIVKHKAVMFNTGL